MRNLFFLLTALILFSLIPQNSFSATAPVYPAAAGEPDPATVKNAVTTFMNLTKTEKREKVRLVKKEMRAFKAAKKAGKEADTNTLLLVILAILLPPLAVYLHQGEINNKFWISLLLTLLFWVPGVIYALIVILGNG